MTNSIWDQARVEKYISDGIEESLNLDYKAAASLAKSDGKKAEITKDVSAMANSAGGIIIYGIAEYQDKAREHLPERIDPIDRTQLSKEWLEHVISNIRPKIDGLLIHPVSINTAPNHVVYIVEIPQSYTAHQATDKRYYKRFNFESVAMDDYEIRDIMGRRQYPHIELQFEIITLTKTVIYRGSTIIPGYVDSLGMPAKAHEKKEVTQYKLLIGSRNTGYILAQYIDAFIEIPEILLPIETEDDIEFYGKRDTYEKDGVRCYQHFADNTERDIIGYTSNSLGGSIPNYGSSRYVPILPKRYFRLDEVDLRGDFDTISLDNLYIHWEISADNAPPLSGSIAVKDIEITSQQESP